MRMLWTLVGFVLVVALTYAVPGPDFAVVLRSALHGRNTGRMAAAGVLLGVCLHITAAALGLSALVAQSASAFTVVKMIGAGYLIFLGVQALLSSGHGDIGDGGPPRDGARRAFVRGFLTNASNPKAVLFFVSLLPQFIDHSAPVVPQVLLLGLCVLVFGVLWWSGFVVLAGRVRTVLTRPRVRRILDRVTGIAFIALSIRLLRTPAAGTAT